ncbi:hypothetical protein [Methanofollis tationis]|uniref:Uncharacterized protein n=1 Tax=Methanofollis tationis TaxID=81417 RepID=A0A7K4HL63_9EURY|nr:hypothetical protein [Methanofollis tationis]NVO65912.1 hypothetical protein [Methanofollis tationis]
MSEKHFSRSTALLSGLFVLLVAIACMAGCTGSDSGATPTTQAPTPTAAGGAPASVSVSAVHYSELIKYLPSATANWETGDKNGGTMSSSEGAWSWAEVTYTQTTNPDTTVTVVIQDTAGMTEGYWTIWDTATVVDTPDFSWKSTTIKGYPAWEFADKTSDEYTLYVGINDRIMVFIDVSNGKKDYLTVFGNLIDFNGLAALT